MPNSTKGIGSFTADHIVAVLRALPDTDGTYAQVIARATEHGAQLSATTLGKWLTTGRADIEAGNAYNAYARFSHRYDSIMAEHCSPDANRSRELDRAFDILDRTCECGTEKMLAPDGSLADRCRGLPRTRPPRAPVPDRQEHRRPKPTTGPRSVATGDPDGTPHGWHAKTTPSRCGQLTGPIRLTLMVSHREALHRLLEAIRAMREAPATPRRSFKTWSPRLSST